MPPKVNASGGRRGELRGHAQGGKDVVLAFHLDAADEEIALVFADAVHDLCPEQTESLGSADRLNPHHASDRNAEVVRAGAPEDGIGSHREVRGSYELLTAEQPLLFLSNGIEAAAARCNPTPAFDGTDAARLNPSISRTSTS